MSNELGFTVKRTVLQQALGNIQSVINNRNVLPILNNVKLDVAGDKLTITGTDMDMVVCETVVIESCEVEGSLTLSASGLYDIVRKMPTDSDIGIRGNSDSTGKVQIKSKGCKFTLPSIRSEDFPVMERGDLNSNFEMAVNDFLKLITKPRFAMSTNEVQYNLTGINLKSFDNSVVASATNAHKLAKVTVATAENIDIPSVILPPKLIGLLAKILLNPAATVRVSLSETKVCIEYGNAIIISKLIDGKFPDIDRVFPLAPTNALTISRELLLAAIDRIALASDVKSRAITIMVNSGVVTITADSAEKGAGEEEIEVETDLVGIKKNYNSKYLIEILSNIEQDTILFSFNQNGEASSIVGDGVNNSEIYLVMTMMDK